VAVGKSPQGLAALLRIGWVLKRQTGSHKTLSREVRISADRDQPFRHRDRRGFAEVEGCV
jgi:hypothetical protein